MRAQVAIIGGTGIYHLFKGGETLQVTTPFGRAAPIELGRLEGVQVAFLCRHRSPNPEAGEGHAVPPHAINYRANLLALRQLGVQRILATSAVGSLRRDLPPGQLVIPHQIIDLTRNRPSTFYDGITSFQVEGHAMPKVAHVDVTDPYCPLLRQLLLESCEQLGLKARSQAVYACTEGPRFETAAEVDMLSRLGADIVGMTQAPEAFLARELAMCYATCALVTNYAAGLAPTATKVTHKETLQTFTRHIDQLNQIFRTCIKLLTKTTASCKCQKALEGATTHP